MRAILALLLAPALARAAPCEKKGTPPISTSGTDTQLVACYGDESGNRCYRLDLPGKTWSPTSEPPAPPPDPGTPTGAAGGPTISITTDVEICGADHKDCRSITAAGRSSTPQVIVAANDDSSLVAMARTPGPLELFEGKTEKRVASIKAWNKSMIDGFQDVAYLGDTVVGRVQDSPVTSQVRLYNGHTGALLAKVGGGTQINDGTPVPLTKTDYLFTGFNGGGVFIHDIVTGKLVHKLDGQLVHVSGDKKTVIALGGAVQLYDVATHTVTRIPGPTCK